MKFKTGQIILAAFAFLMVGCLISTIICEKNGMFDLPVKTVPCEVMSMVTVEGQGPDGPMVETGFIQTVDPNTRTVAVTEDFKTSVIITNAICKETKINK